MSASRSSYRGAVIKTLSLFSSVLFSAGHLYAQASPAPMATPSVPMGSEEHSVAKPSIVPQTKGEKSFKKTIRVVQPREFCQRLTNTMTTLGSQLANDRRTAVRIGGKASAAVISQLKSGNMMPYLDTENFQLSATPERERRWFSLAEVLVSSLGGVPKNVILISDMNDLKLTPLVMPGSQFLVLAKSLDDMTAEKAKSLAMMAQALGLEINIIWINPSREAKETRAAQGLAFMAALTGGAFLDLSFEGTCGQT